MTSISTPALAGIAHRLADGGALHPEGGPGSGRVQHPATAFIVAVGGGELFSRIDAARLDPVVGAPDRDDEIALAVQTAGFGAR